MRRKSVHPIPQLRFHKARQLGFVVLNDRYVYLGKWDDPRLQDRYDRAIAEWIARGRRPEVVANLLIAELIATCLPSASASNEVLSRIILVFN